MKHVLAVVACVVFLFGMGACGGDKTPTKPTPTVTCITINGATDMLKVKEIVTFSATAVHSDGSNVTVTDWSRDAPGVAIIDSATGALTGVSAGQITIIARHDGMTATRLIRVVPDYQGSWSGSYRVTTCTDSGGFASYGWCSAMRGLTLPIAISLSQSRDTVSGTIAFHEYTGSTSGPIAINGSIALSGTASAGTDTMTISNWNTNVVTPGSMAGSVSTRISSPSVSGSALHGCDLTTMTKSGTALTFGFESPVSGKSARSFEDLLRAIGVKK